MSAVLRRLASPRHLVALAFGLGIGATSPSARSAEPSPAAPTQASPAPSPAETQTETEPDATAPAKPARRFVLIIGSNHTLDDTQAPLRFADDDAATMAELMVQTGADTELVTTFDQDSQAVFSELVSRAHRPNPQGVERAFSGLLTRMEAAKERGDLVELLIYYSGHGDVGPDGQGFLTLEGGKLTRHGLFAGLLSRSVADYNHVIIDACRSEHFVLSRGGDWKPDRAPVELGRAVQQYLDNNHLGAFPNTGVLLAHSADQQTHEWDRYRGGIFTHELVSGLRGGADLNGDGRVEYSELGAFVSAANHGVDDPRARLEVVVRPPANDERRPVLDHGRLADHRLLLFGPGDRHHYTVEDGRGLRLADLRRSGEQAGYLRLPDGELFLERKTTADDRQEAELSADQGGVLFTHLLPFSDATAEARGGSLDQAFRRGLFTTPFGPGYYHGYTAQRGLLGVAEPGWQGPTPDSVQSAEPAKGWSGRAPRDGEEVIIIDSNEEADDDDQGLGAAAERMLDRRGRSRPWGGVFLGVGVTPFAPSGTESAGTRRVNANDARACLAPGSAGACRQVRGFDLRWQLFRVETARRFPRFLGYFRSGYEGGRINFSRDGGFLSGDASALSYVSVPLYFAGNIYLFDEFPLRPFAGLGVGLDVIRLDYARVNADRLTDTVVRPGFELHAGLELRLTNYVSLTGEVKQQWSARKKISGVPDFANEGVTFITGVAIGFPLRR